MDEEERITRNLARNIQWELERQNISGRQLAIKAGRNPMTVNHCINGRTVPKAPLIIAIAKALGTTVEKLAGEPVKTKPRRAKQTA